MSAPRPAGNVIKKSSKAFAKPPITSPPSIPRANSIPGSFSPGHNLLHTRNPDLWFEMRALENGFFQTAWSREKGRIVSRTERMDIVVGSGKIGQTYLYWRGGKLFQLPVSYFTEAKRWINSPGYPDGKAYFDRPVIPRCVECHATYFEVVSEEDPMRPYLSNAYSRDNYLLGITCERCHGPGDLHSKNRLERPGSGANCRYRPSRTTRPGTPDGALRPVSLGSPGPARTVPFPSNLARDLKRSSPWRAFGPGTAEACTPPINPNVFAAPECFQESGSMTCMSCHDPHHLERGEPANCFPGVA